MSDNPYQAAETDSTPVGPPTLEQPSSIPKVFGIIHLVYAGLGVISGIASFGSSAFTKLTSGPIIEIAQKNGKSTAAYEAAIEQLGRYAMVNGIIQIALAILILIAGLNLLKYRLKGASLSRLWALIRIPCAIIIAALTMGPTSKMLAAQSDLISTDNTPMSGMMDAMGAFSVVMNVVMVSIYPIITLVFMTRQKVIASLK